MAARGAMRRRRKKNVPTPKFDDAGNPVVVGPPTTGADVQANLSKGHRRNIPKPSPTKAAPAAPAAISLREQSLEADPARKAYSERLKRERKERRIPKGQSSQEIDAKRQTGEPGNLFGRPRETFEKIPKSNRQRITQWGTESVTDPSLAGRQALEREKKAGDIQTEIDKVRAMTEGIRGGYAHGGGVRGVGKALRGFRPAKMS